MSKPGLIVLKIVTVIVNVYKNSNMLKSGSGCLQDLQAKLETFLHCIVFAQIIVDIRLKAFNFVSRAIQWPGDWGVIPTLKLLSCKSRQQKFKLQEVWIYIYHVSPRQISSSESSHPLNSLVEVSHILSALFSNILLVSSRPLSL